MWRKRGFRRRRRHRGCFGRLVLGLVLCVLVLLVSLRGCVWLQKERLEQPLIQLYHHQTGELSTLALEDYVAGVVAAEMPVSFAFEALKAQAVAARTYAYRRIIRGDVLPDNPKAHVSTDYRTGQAWVSWEELRQRWDVSSYLMNKRRIIAAVEQTEGLIAVHEEEPILAVYHSTSGGRTENSEHYWSEQLAYLRSVDDPYAAHSPYRYSEHVFTPESLLERLDIEAGDRLEIIARYPSGRVQTAAAGGTWFSGREIRQRLELPSSWFSLEQQDEQLMVAVWGYGHGVGLSQYGADGMAAAGYNYRQILHYYYQDIDLVKVY